MSNSKRSLIFTIGLLLTIFPIIYSLRFFSTSSDTFIINMLLAFQLIWFPILQMAQRYFFSRKYLYEDTIYFKLNLAGANIKGRVISYLLIGLQLIYFYIKYNKFSEVNIPLHILNIIIWLVIVEVTLIITNKKTYGSFSNHSIIISGLDLKIDLPLNDPLNNDSGIFSYNDFSEFAFKGNKLILYLYDRRGIYTFNVDKNFEVPIREFLKAKRIGEKAAPSR
ncbi:MAG: hypothetical protein N4A76_07395 [Firmicutes bacterium]|nr:hypothetical protein [Bacillota bacterium]